jgi:hypothetical protein
VDEHSQTNRKRWTFRQTEKEGRGIQTEERRRQTRIGQMRSIGLDKTQRDRKEMTRGTERVKERERRRWASAPKRAIKIK